MSVIILFQPAGDVDNRNVTLAVTGGGVVAATGQKGGSRTGALTGSGVVTLSLTKATSATIVLTGGGVVTLVGEAAVGAEAHSGTVVLTGGGVITIGYETSGSIVIVAEEGSVQQMLDGAGPVAKRRRAGHQTPFDDWTILMDDEAIVELYALRKTR